MVDDDDWEDENFGAGTTDLYGVLGIERDALTKDIKSAYRKLAKQYHPDNKKTGDVNAFNLIQQAYDILMDSVAREHYDQTGEIGGAQSRKRPDDKSEIYELVLSFFSQASDKVGGNYKMVNLLDVARLLMEESMEEGRVNIEKANKEANATRDIMSRLHFTGDGFDPIKRSLERSLESLHEAITNVTGAIEFRRQALEYLKHYKYTIGDGGNWMTPFTNRGTTTSSNSFRNLLR